LEESDEYGGLEDADEFESPEEVSLDECDYCSSTHFVHSCENCGCYFCMGCGGDNEDGLDLCGRCDASGIKIFRESGVDEYAGLEDADEFAEGLGAIYVVIHPDHSDDRSRSEQCGMSADDLEDGLIRLFDKLGIQCVFVRDQQHSRPVSISGRLSTDIPLGYSMPRPGPGEGVRIEIAGSQIPFMG
jgi:hypothetical protein